jgi:dihydrofolate reductase
MARVSCDITMSLDGFIAGPSPSIEKPLGEGGERLHEWVYGLESWRRLHGLSGGTTNADSEILEEAVDGVGASVMGRKMFSGGTGPWEDDPRADGWWGDDPPFHTPVFVVTHHPRETLVKEGGTSFVFVTGGAAAALEQARAAAGGRDVAVAGGASVLQQLLGAGLVDELQVHIAPLFLGGGTRLFGDLDRGVVDLECTRVMQSPSVTHLRYRVVK